MVDGQPLHGIDPGLVVGASPPRLQEALSFPRRGVLVRPCLTVTLDLPTVWWAQPIQRTAEVVRRPRILLRMENCPRTCAIVEPGRVHGPCSV